MNKREKRVYSIESDYMEQYELEQNLTKRRQKALFRRLAVAGMVMLLLIAILTHYHIGQRALYSEKVEQHDALQTELSELEKVERELQEEINLLNDETYILDIARTNYFLSKEGELIFQLEDFSNSY